jgi:formylglycine-generating enzyme required for sulfatase activity
VGIPKKLEAEKQILPQKEAKFREAMQYGEDYSNEVNEIQARVGRIKTLLTELKEREFYFRARGMIKNRYGFQQNSIGITFNLIPSGEFMMGCSPDDSQCDEHEISQPQHKVKITKPFFMGITEITQGQWKAIMGNNPSYYQNCGDNCPVENISWNVTANLTPSKDFAK